MRPVVLAGRPPAVTAPRGLAMPPDRGHTRAYRKKGNAMKRAWAGRAIAVAIALLTTNGAKAQAPDGSAGRAAPRAPAAIPLVTSNDGIAFIAARARSVASSTASTTTLAQDPFGSAVDFIGNYYTGFRAMIVSGSGAGQTRTIGAWTGGLTPSFAVTPAWATAPDATSVIDIVSPGGSAGGGNRWRWMVATQTPGIGHGEGGAALLQLDTSVANDWSSAATVIEVQPPGLKGQNGTDSYINLVAQILNLTSDNTLTNPPSPGGRPLDLGPQLVLSRNATGPAGSTGGTLQLNFWDSANVTQTGTFVSQRLVDNTAGHFTTELAIVNALDAASGTIGSASLPFVFDGGFSSGDAAYGGLWVQANASRTPYSGPHGTTTSKGPGTINAVALYRQGHAVATLDLAESLTNKTLITVGQAAAVNAGDLGSFFADTDGNASLSIRNGNGGARNLSRLCLGNDASPCDGFLGLTGAANPGLAGQGARGVALYSNINTVLYAGGAQAALLDATQHLRPGGTGAPVIASGACGSATNGTLSAGSNDHGGLVAIGPADTATCTVTFAKPYATAPRACSLTPANAVAAAQGTTMAYVAAISATRFVISGRLAGAQFYYQCL